MVILTRAPLNLNGGGVSHEACMHFSVTACIEKCLPHEVGIVMLPWGTLVLGLYRGADMLGLKSKQGGKEIKTGIPGGMPTGAYAFSMRRC